MSDLTDRIRAAQVHAGEQVVMDDLRKRGLLGDPCPACKGTGEGSAGECPCAECGGSGKRDHSINPISER